MGLFKRNKVIYLKSSNILKEEYNDLNKLYKKSIKVKKRLLELENIIELKDKINKILKNINIDMYIIEDINIKYAGYKTSINYILITKYNIYIIDLLNLTNNISMNNDIINNIHLIDDKEYVDNIKYLDIYNNHYNSLKMIGFENKKMVDKIIFENTFKTYYKCITVLNNNKDLNENLISINNLANYIKNNNKEAKKRFNKKMMNDLGINILSKQEIRI